MAAREMRAAPRRLLLLTALGRDRRGRARGHRLLHRQPARLRAAPGARRSSAPTSRCRAAARCRRRRSAVLDTLARAGRHGRPAHQLRRHGLRAPHQRHPAGAGGRRRGAAIPSTARSAPSPPPPGASCQRGGRVVVDPSLLTALGARVGDTLAAGRGAVRHQRLDRERARATSGSAPRSARASTSPPRDLAATRLLGFGSRAEYEAFVRLPAAVSPQAARRSATGRRCGPSGSRVRTVAEDQRESQRRARPADRLSRPGGADRAAARRHRRGERGGGLHPAAARHDRGAPLPRRERGPGARDLRRRGGGDGARRQRRRRGARRAGAAAAAGAAGRAAAGGRRSRRSRPAPWRSASAWGSGWRWSSRCIPLLAVRRVPPLAALRRDVEPERAPAATRGGSRPWPRSRPARWRSPALQVGSWRQGAIFSGGVAGALLVLWGASWALIRAARRWLPGGWPYVWRQGLANLHRPSNQTATVVLAIGFGAFLLGTLFLVQYNLLRTLRLTGGPDAAQPRAVRHPARPARRGRARARGARATARSGRCRSCRCGSSRSRAGRSTLARADTAGDGRRPRPAERLGAPARVPLDLPRLAGGLGAAGGGTLVDARRAAPTEISVERDVAARAGRRRRRRDRVGRAGRAARHPGRQPARGGLGPVRAQLLRGLRAGRAGGGAADAA